MTRNPIYIENKDLRTLDKVMEINKKFFGIKSLAELKILLKISKAARGIKAATVLDDGEMEYILPELTLKFGKSGHLKEVMKFIDILRRMHMLDPSTENTKSKHRSGYKTSHDFSHTPSTTHTSGF